MMRKFSKQEIVESIKKHSACNETLLQKIINIPTAVLENFGSKEARKIQKMSKEVYRDFERARQFTRTKVIRDKFMWGIFWAEHSIEEMLGQYFHNRFPHLLLCLYNENKKECLIKKPHTKSDDYVISKGSLKENLFQLGVNLDDKSEFLGTEFDNNENKEIYETFYQSQFIKERNNPQYFQAMVPKNVRKNYKLKIEQQIGNKKLDDFF